MTTFDIRNLTSFLTMGSDEQRNNEVTVAYYENEDAFRFYNNLWGGEYICIGTQHSAPHDQLTKEGFNAGSATASQYICSLVQQHLNGRKGLDVQVLDMGSGYGGTARLVAKSCECTVICCELCSLQNEVNRRSTAAANLDKYLRVPQSMSYTETGEPDASVDVVVSQDAFMHAGLVTEQAIAEASRIMKPGALFIISDPLEADDADKSDLAATYARLNLTSMCSMSMYLKWAEKYNFDVVVNEDRTQDFITHYSALSRLVKEKQPEIGYSVEFAEKASAGAAEWAKQARSGLISWKLLCFRKRPTA